MKKTLLAAVAATMALGTLAPAAMAANARHPYRNIDRRVDKGGPTGDAQVDKLNQQQLDAARATNSTGLPLPPTGMAPARPLGQ